MPRGSAYVLERWGAPAGESVLQRQVRRLFARLEESPEQVLAGNLVPFRSPNWHSLANKDAALRFGRELWSRILDRARPELVITMGSETAKSVKAILNVSDLERIPVGWGKYTAERGSFADGSFVGLPHLSRFTIFGREESEPALRRLFPN